VARRNAVEFHWAGGIGLSLKIFPAPFADASTGALPLQNTGAHHDLLGSAVTVEPLRALKDRRSQGRGG
jgi:hypothetical protein